MAINENTKVPDNNESSVAVVNPKYVEVELQPSAPSLTVAAATSVHQAAVNPAFTNDNENQDYVNNKQLFNLPEKDWYVSLDDIHT